MFAFSLSYLARQKYTLSQTAGVCMNVHPLLRGPPSFSASFVLQTDQSLPLIGALAVLLLVKESAALFCLCKCQ